MANNPVVNTLSFSGSVAESATIQAQGIAGGLTFLLPNTSPIQGQLMTATVVNGNNVFLGWSSAQSLSNIPLSALAQSGATSGQIIEWNGTAWAPASAVPGAGTVTSVALTAPAEFTVGGSPITSSGTLAITKASQSQNLVWASPNGSSGVPVFRALVAGDIPALSALSGALSVSQINSKQGGGSAVQIAAGSFTNGHVVTFDSTGNTSDSGVAGNTLVTGAAGANGNIQFNNTGVFAGSGTTIDTAGNITMPNGTALIASGVQNITGHQLSISAVDASNIAINGFNSSQILVGSGGQITLTAASGQVIAANSTILAEGNIDLSDNHGHIISNGDNAGTVTITNPATTVAVVYGSNYTSTAAPNVVVTAVGSDPSTAAAGATSVGGVWITHQGGANAWTGFTINVTTTPATSLNFSYHVIG